VAVTFSGPELSADTGVSEDRLQWLTKIGVLKPDERGRYGPGDTFRVKMVSALLDAGYRRDQIEMAAAGGTLNLDHVDHYLLVEPSPPSGRTFERFARDRGGRASAMLPAVYQVLGLPQPDPSSPIRIDEEQLFEQFLDGWSLARDDDTLVRAARLIGEGTRLVALGWADLLNEEITGPARERFLRGQVEHYPPEVVRAATVVIGLIPRFMAWLSQRYVEQLIIAGIVEGFEAVLAAKGLAPEPKPALTTPPAVVFVDVSGYTRLTEEHGDEVAVRVASSLQRHAEEVATRNGGRLVKLLGDGAMLHFRDPRRGVEAAIELVATLTSDVGVPAHAGVHAGQLIERDRDLYGRTVNLASRIAAAARPGEVVLSEAVIQQLDDAFDVERVERAPLRGVAEPVPLYRVSVAPPVDGDGLR
jgi:class 3 adenylate cyclase